MKLTVLLGTCEEVLGAGDDAHHFISHSVFTVVLKKSIPTQIRQLERTCEEVFGAGDAQDRAEVRARHHVLQRVEA